MIFQAVNEENDDDTFIVVSNSDESVHSENDSEVFEAEELSNIENYVFLEEEAESRPRKKMRHYQSHKSFIAKDRVERGLERVSKKSKKVIPTKVFNAQIICKCLDDKAQKLSCAHKINVVRQKEIFDCYYQQMNWTHKTMFIRGHVKRLPVKTKKCQNYPLLQMKSRNFNHSYTLTDEKGIDQDVCRDFFINCLQITPYRVYNALNTQDKNPSASEVRGKSASINKTSEFIHQEVVNFINRIPKYESHYGRSETQRKYLPQSLNLAILYEAYKGQRDPKKKECASEFIFRKIFNTNFQNSI